MLQNKGILTVGNLLVQVCKTANTFANKTIESTGAVLRAQPAAKRGHLHHVQRAGEAAV